MARGAGDLHSVVGRAPRAVGGKAQNFLTSKVGLQVVVLSDDERAELHARALAYETSRIVAQEGESGCEPE